jgi:hypothetical protein
LNSLSLEKDPDPLSPITPRFLGQLCSAVQVNNKFTIQKKKIESISLKQVGKDTRGKKIISNNSREYREHYCSRKM